MNNERLSNFELLRIYSMLGILVSHVLMSCYDLHTTTYTWANELRMYIMNAGAVGVNCFVLISGYFCIKLSVKGVVRLYGQCFFFGLLTFLIFGLKNCVWNYYTIRGLFFACSQNNLWFIPAYLGLMFVSPVLNKAFEHSDHKTRFLHLGFLLFVNVYIGYLHQSEEVNHLGTNLFQLITIYYLGRCMTIFPKYEHIKWGILAVLLFGVMTILHAIKMKFLPISVIYSLHHNAPSTIIAAFVVFQFFRNLHVQNKWINYVASSVLPVYLIHMNPLVKYRLMDFITDNSSSYTPIIECLLVAFIILIFFSVSIFLDKVRIFLFGHIECKISDKISYSIHHFLSYEG